MKKHLAYILAITLILGLSFPTTGEEGGLIVELESWVEREREARLIPGAGLALVRDGKLVHVSGYGEASPEHKRPATADTLFRVGSVSKPITATALLQLLEQEALGPDSDIRPNLADLSLSPPLAESLTPHHLLTHTCGLNEHLFGQHARSREHFQSLKEYLVDHLPPRFEKPGKVISYNDYCTSLAGFLIEELSGQSFHEYVSENLFAKLGMESSSFDQLWHSEDWNARTATASRWHAGRHEPYARDYIMTTPAAGLWTTPRDMGRYLEFLLAEGGNILSPGALERQRSVQFTHHEKLSGRAYGFASMTWRGHRIFYKDGQASGFSARLVMVPETGDGFFIVQNRSIFDAMGAINSAGRFNRELTMAWLEALFPTPTDEPEHVVPLPSDEDVSQFAGSYRNVVAARHSYEKIITLMDDIIITNPAPGTLQFGSVQLVSRGEGLFQHRQGDTFHMAFDDLEAPRYLFLGGGAYERVSPLMNSRNAPLFLGGLLGVILVVLLVSLRPAIRQGQAQKAARVLAFSSLLKLGGVVGIGLCFWLIDLQTFFAGAPQPLLVALSLPPLGLLLDLWLLGVWRKAGALTKVLILLHLFAAAGLAFWLWYWNLLGWKLG